ncbi:hypothetical protein DHEL01_v209024 [Diaporthe helianthi]|uniref:2EXR domain-containing protein n=1 Tax=Diaporthe helianthi TaxID=158607 RepID=A0A2P5HQR2_DIAHE|nr:hypothetical protein DHEL01_v209024 [Diaporthe helianthi]
MSVEQCLNQPKTPGSLFRLPLELREIIWKMVILNPPPRVCPVSVRAGEYAVGDYWHLALSKLDELFVYDYPSLLYICRDTRYETVPLFNAVGWRISGQEPPKRPYNPYIGILYPNLMSWIFMRFLSEATGLLNRSGDKRRIPVAVEQLRKARHIAIDYTEPSPRHKIEFETLLPGLPHVEKVSMIISNVSMKAKGQFGPHEPFLQLPKRPCTLNKVPSLQASSSKLEVSKKSITEWIRRYQNKKAYKGAEMASLKFSAEADEAADLLFWQRLPTPQPVMLLKMVRLPTAEEGEVWEEVEVCINGRDIKD